MAGHPQAPASRVPGRAVDPRRHHQGSQDGQRHRARGPRVRAADPAAGRAHRRLPTSSRTPSRWPRATCRAATSSVAVSIPGDLRDDPGGPAPAPAALHEPADQRLRGDRTGAGTVRDRRRPSCPRKRTPAGGEAHVGADGAGRRDRRRAGRAARRHGPDLQSVLHDQAPGLRARARRSSARSSTPTTGASTSACARAGHAVPGHAAGLERTLSAGRFGVVDADVARGGREASMGRILVADDHDSLRRGHRPRAVGRAGTRSTRRRTATSRSRSCTKGSTTSC